MKISLPIDIKKNEDNKIVTNNNSANNLDNVDNVDIFDNEEYSLKFNNFDPNKMSPPSEWRGRLESRIKIHYTFTLENE